MAEEEKQQQKIVRPYTVMASGVAAIVAALFTSKLGVAGTLIGTALTAMTINLGSAVLTAQLEKASTRVSALPTTVRDRLSTQQVRVPGKPSPEPDPESPTRPEARDKRGGLLSRLRAIPNYLKNLSPARRRSILLTGVLTGLVATFIGLGGITGIELATGKNISCQLWRECPTTTTGAPTGSSGGSGLSILGGSPVATPEANPPQNVPGEQQPVPQDQQVPGQQRPAEPAQPAPNNGAGQPDQQQGADPAQPKADPNAEEPAAPGR